MSKNTDYTKRFQKAKLAYDNKQFQEALSNLESLTKDFPDKAEPLSYYGRCIAALGDRVYAMSYFLKAAELEPNNAEHQIYIGHCLNSVGQTISAIEKYKNALAIDPDNLIALSALGTLLISIYNNEEAIETLNKAITIKPSNADNQSNLATALSRVGRYEDAIKHANKAIKSEPNNIYGYYRLGQIYMELGNEIEARRCFSKAIDIDPTHGPSYFAFASVKKITKDDNHIVRKMEKALEKSMPADMRKQLLFALAKANDDLQDTDKAIKYISKANMLIHSDYDPKIHTKYLQQLKQFFNKNYFISRKVSMNDNYTPIFVVGMPRSGSTLIDQILSSHTRVHSAGESPAIPNILLDISSANKSNKEYPECINDLDEEDLKHYQSVYLDMVGNNAWDKTYIVDKNLFNHYRLGFIATLFPNAKIINTLRHPLDTSFSCYLTGFNFTESTWTHNLEYIGKYYRDYMSIMDYWRTVLPIPILDVRYEDVVLDTEASVKRILDFCNLEWEDNCLEFYKTKRSVTTASNWQVRQPIYKSAMRRWVPYAKHLQPLILALGDLLEEDYEFIESLGLKHGPRRDSLRGKLSKLFS